MTAYQKEQLDIIRRTAERGRWFALNHGPNFVEVFQHILDELERLCATLTLSG